MLTVIGKYFLYAVAAIYLLKLLGSAIWILSAAEKTHPFLSRAGNYSFGIAILLAVLRIFYKPVTGEGIMIWVGSITLCVTIPIVCVLILMLLQLPSLFP